MVGSDMNCRHAQKTISDWAAGLTDVDLAAEVKDHAEECPPCGQVLARELRLTRVLRTPERAGRAPAGLSARIDGAIRAAARSRRPGLRWLPATAACASIAFVAAGGLWLGSVVGGLQAPLRSVATAQPAPGAAPADAGPAVTTQQPSGAQEASTAFFDAPAKAPARARPGTAYASPRASRRSTPTPTDRPEGQGGGPLRTVLVPDARAPGPVEVSLAMDVPADEVSMDFGAGAEPIVAVASEGSSDIVLAGVTSLTLAPAVSSSSVVPAPPTSREVHSR